MDKLDKIKQDKAELIQNIGSLIQTFLNENPDVEIDRFSVDFTKHYSDNLRVVTTVDDIRIDIKI